MSNKIDFYKNSTFIAASNTDNNKAVSGNNDTTKIDVNKSTGDPEKDKKIRKINDKLTQIAKLKQQVKEGKQLEVNQLDKIKREGELIKELKQLQL